MILTGSRQSGKTTALIDLAYDYARANNRSRVLVVAPYKVNVENMIHMVKARADNVSIVRVQYTPNSRVLLFNGSEIIFYISSSRHTGVRGQSVDQAYIDVDTMTQRELEEIEATIIPYLPPEGRLWEAYNID